jgi:tRNA(Ile)-lysidine synthase
MLIAREEAAVMGPVEARPGTMWDNRFRLVVRQGLRTGATIGKLGADAARFRGVSDLPSVVLRTLPAIRFGKVLAAVPHLSYAASGDDTMMTLLFTPPRPLAGAGFVPTLSTSG